MSEKQRKNYSREFKMEAVGLITEKGYSIAEASRNLGIEYSVLRRWKKQIADDPQYAFPGKGRLKAPDEELRRLQRELQRNERGSREGRTKGSNCILNLNGVRMGCFSILE